MVDTDFLNPKHILNKKLPDRLLTLFVERDPMGE